MIQTKVVGRGTQDGDYVEFFMKVKLKVIWRSTLVFLMEC